MKKLNKFLSVLIATILILSTFPMSMANATDNTVIFTVEANQTNVNVGDIIDVSINVTENSNLACLTMYLTYDNTAMEFVSVSGNGKFGFEEFNTTSSENEVRFFALNSEPVTSAGAVFTAQFKVLKAECTEFDLVIKESYDIDENAINYQAELTKIHNYVDGTCTGCGEKSVKWKFDEATGTLTIYGTGSMEDYDYFDGNRPWEGYIDDIKTVVIEDGVTSIGNYAFAYCESLASVTIGDSVTTIGGSAFCSCDSLTSVTIPNNVIIIGGGAFEECTNLTNVIIPDSVTTIGCSAFDECISITDVHYSGCEEDWDSISIDSSYNDSLLNARIHYNSTGADTHPYLPVITPSTCTEQGYTTYTCACGYSNGVIDNYVDATGHSYNLTVTPPTCTEQGFTTYTCECGDTYVDDYTETISHSYKEEITKIPTHTEKGEKTFTCEICGDTYTETIEADGKHKYVPSVTKEPSCTETGVMTYVCACSDEYTEEIPALGHTSDDEIEENYSAPTCTENGNVDKVVYCGVCDAEISRKTEAISMLGHKYESTVTSPTCTEDGYTTYTCSVCAYSYTDNIVSALGHSFKTGSCTTCGEEDPDYYTFIIVTPSRTTIRNKDGIILHTEITGNAPEGAYVKWESSNNNFDKTVLNDSDSLRVVANNKGNTTFTAILCDADGNELARDTVELYSKSSFFDKIGGFFRSLFGSTKIYEN